MGGILAARGEYVIMGDADDSYDFTNLMPFVDELRKGYDLVMGNRFKGGIEPGAMPPLHRYLGNPVLSFIGRLFFRSTIGDFHCGLRGFRRDSAIALGLQATGMEFASEMVVKATLAKQKITEVPTTLAKDGRSRPPHLRSWRDGWRHLRFLLLFSPRWLFFIPGLVLLLVGLVLGAAVAHRARSPSAASPSTWTRLSRAARWSSSGSRRCCSGCSPRCTRAPRASCRPSPRCRRCSASSPSSAACWPARRWASRASSA